MNDQIPFYIRLTFQLILATLIVFILFVARDILIPFTIAVFFTFLLLPISNKLHAWKVPKALSIIISIIVAAIFFVGLLYFFYSQVISFADDLPLLEEKLYQKLETIQQFVYSTFDISKSDQRDWLNAKLQENSNSSGKIIVNLFTATGALLANFSLIPIYIFFLTFYKDKFRQFVVAVVTNDNHEKVLEVFKKISMVSQKYLKGVFLDVLILSILNSTGFLILGLKHAILFGVLAAILNIVPYIGVLVGSILPVIMALLTKDEIGYAIGAAGVCIVVQFLDNNFITPYVVGSSVSINPLTAILVLVASANLWGVAGMILCLPLTGMLKVVCDHVDRLKPYGFLIGEEVNFSKRKVWIKRKPS
jgi:predicted PurR-regulated permease PerM